VTAEEKRFAARVERERTAAMKRLAKQAEPGAVRHAEVIRQITQTGARISENQPPSGALVVEATERQLARIRMIAGVDSVGPFEQPIAMAREADGSVTWHTNGFTGQAGNPDLPSSTDGVDVVVYDNGITTAHKTFNTRLPSDCATCTGTGGSMDPAHPAAGANTRIVSPAGRSNFSGSDHGNTIAAAIGSTNLESPGWYTGLAFGIDRLYDVQGAKNPGLWMMGVRYQGEDGVVDLPEVMNYSQGTYEDTIGYNTDWDNNDAMIDQLGITEAVAAGNCGVQDAGFTNCGDGPHRVVTPANLFNVLSVGGMNYVSSDPSTWRVWQNSSSGPTWDGRKKPDLIATPTPSGGGPKTYDVDGNGQLDDYGNTGIGTSYAAPQVAAGAALLASIGVSSPIAQRAILVNTARPIQNQTYWTPTSGWGALDLERAFNERGNWAMSTATGNAEGVANTARFFRITGASAGDRTTLTWNRRTTQLIDPQYGPSPVTYKNLTNLDLTQLSPADSSGATITSTGGSDAADTVDANLTASGTPGNNAQADNPMPGSGLDGGDNIEQVRSTATGTQLLKVKALSAVDGQSSEPFALASQRPITALASPIPNVSLSADVNKLKSGGEAVLTVTSTNPSSDLALTNASVTLNPLPAGVVVVGASTQSLGTLSSGSPQTVAFTVQGTAEGIKQIRATAAGSAYGETFAGSNELQLTVDDTPPDVNLAQWGTWSTQSAPLASWDAQDALTSVASYDVEKQLAGGAWTRVIDAGTDTELATTGAGEGESVALRVRARDAVGNMSDWSQAQTTIDAVPPAITFGAATTVSKGQVRVPVTITNVGSPIVSKTWRFDPYSGDRPATPLEGAATYRNTGGWAQTATLYVWASDALGRTVQLTGKFGVPPGVEDLRIKIRSAKVKKRKLTLSGTVPADYSGKLKVTITRRGKTGTKKVSRKVAVRGGRWKISTKLKKGSYKVVVAGPRDVSGGYAAASTSKTVRVR
jgi:hypothetical protein